MPLLSQFLPETGTGLGRINQHFPSSFEKLLVAQRTQL
jgi:hypothetical protein